MVPKTVQGLRVLGFIRSSTKNLPPVFGNPNVWVFSYVRGSTQYKGSTACEDCHAFNKASLSNTLRSFLSHTMATPFPFLDPASSLLLSAWKEAAIAPLLRSTLCTIMARLQLRPSVQFSAIPQQHHNKEKLFQTLSKHPCQNMRTKDNGEYEQLTGEGKSFRQREKRGSKSAMANETSTVRLHISSSSSSLQLSLPSLYNLDTI